jgi:hypothetical protein
MYELIQRNWTYLRSGDADAILQRLQCAQNVGLTIHFYRIQKSHRHGLYALLQGNQELLQSTV